jgi:hypothetical protein
MLPLQVCFGRPWQEECPQNAEAQGPRGVMQNNKWSEVKLQRSVKEAGFLVLDEAQNEDLAPVKHHAKN